MLKYSVCGKVDNFFKVVACGTYTGALNSLGAKPVNLSVHDPYKLSSLSIENNVIYI